MRRRMNRRRNRNNLLFATLLLFLVGSVIGYASLHETLTIEGNTTVAKNVWDVRFNNIEVIDNHAQVETAPEIVDNGTKVNFVIKLDKPGDSYTFIVDVENNGDIDAMIGTKNLVDGLAAKTNYLDYKLSYIDGVEIEQGNLLRKGEKDTIKFTVTFKKDITASDLETEAEQSLTITLTSTYVQADNTATERQKPGVIVGEYDTPNSYELKVPYTGKYKVDLWGASGGSYANAQQGNTTVTTVNGGRGAYTSGIIELTKGETIYVYTGEIGKRSKQEINFNGGGHGGTSSQSGTGGSATDVRLVNGNWDNFNSLKSRIMVAAGGGAPYGYYYGGTGGDAGGLTGYKGTVGTQGKEDDAEEGGTGATQTSPGLGGIGSDPPYSGHASGEAGFFGIGGSDFYTFGSGGGSGYYGGGAGGAHPQRGGAGGGGSSFISGHNGCDAIAEESTENNIIHTNDSEHYSHYKFTNTVMIDGAGCRWTTINTNECNGQIQPDGTTATGHIGDGYARITFIERTY